MNHTQLANIEHLESTFGRLPTISAPTRSSPLANTACPCSVSFFCVTPGRYVGVAPAEVDEDFDFEQAISDIHVELADLNQEATALAKKIQKNFDGLGI